MRTSLLIIVGLLTGIVVLSACAGSRQSAPTPRQASQVVDTSEMAIGQALFAGTCAACHGSTGEGIEGLGPDLTTRAFVGHTSDEDLLNFIKTGRPASDPTNTTGVPMPPRGGNPNLTDEQLKEIITYLRSIYQE
jgi:mono/diheme cytochrome c family protein